LANLCSLVDFPRNYFTNESNLIEFIADYRKISTLFDRFYIFKLIIF
jgi:hypothetical protein